jgi:arabinogalactan endo-1,4-beta-galactosidase
MQGFWKDGFWRGADISSWDEISSEGGAFYDNGVETELPDILKRSGINSVRLRLWNDPAGSYCSLERTVKTAARLKKEGFHLMLDFHYSDFWADPQKQSKPKAWEHLSFTGLAEAIREFTREAIKELKAHDALPDMVQIGNEITPGMLWDDGRTDGEWDTEAQWSKLGHLLKSAMRGLQEALNEEDAVQVMLHIDRGGDHAGSRYFFDRLNQLGVDFDVIGLSYYPWWHGTLEQLSSNLEQLAHRYDKDIIVVEAAYPWTLSSGGRELDFIVGSEAQLHDGFPATVEGQTAFLERLLELVKHTPNGRGKGVYYWEPAWIPSKQQWSVGHGNNWANLTLFGFGGERLESMDVFRKRPGNSITTETTESIKSTKSNKSNNSSGLTESIEKNFSREEA